MQKHCASYALKSPVSSAAVGTTAGVAAGADRINVP